MEERHSETKAIWKFPLRIMSEEGFKVEMPEGAKVLCVQMQRGQPCMWAEVDVTAAKVNRSFSVFTTGWERSNRYQGAYIGTVQTESDLVFHFYQDLP